MQRRPARVHTLGRGGRWTWIGMANGVLPVPERVLNDTLRGRMGPDGR
jgi:hypothetical protein